MLLNSMAMANFLRCRVCFSSMLLFRNSLVTHSALSRSSSAFRVLFFGSDEFSFESLKKLNDSRLKESCSVINHLEVVTSIEQKIQNPIQKFAALNQLTVHNWPCKIEENYFDLGIVVSFGHLIPEHIISLFPWGIINVHGSILPRWRGAAPVVHAILNGDKETGVTIMKIEPHHFDTGNILAIKTHSISEDITEKQLKYELAVLGADLLLECLNNLPYYMMKSYVQPSFGITKAPKPRAKMANINWTVESSIIYRQFRAIGEYFKLYTHWKNTPVKLDKMLSPKEMEKLNIDVLVNKLPEKDTFSFPGRIYLHRKRNILCVRCKDNWAGFQEVTVPRSKTKSAKDFYNGFLSKVDPKEQIFAYVSS